MMKKTKVFYMTKRKYQDQYKIIAEDFANNMIELISSLGVKIENTENQKNAIVNNVKNDFRKNIPNIDLFKAENSAQRMNLINGCQLLDLLEIVEIMSPENLRSALYREFVLTCTIVEALVLSPSQKNRVENIKKNMTVFNLIWKPYQIYFDDMMKIKPLMLKIYEFQTQEHVKQDLNLYTSNPQIGKWIHSVRQNPRYHSEFKKYVGFLRKQA
jgi:hypothetical protein